MKKQNKKEFAVQIFFIIATLLFSIIVTNVFLYYMGFGGGYCNAMKVYPKDRTDYAINGWPSTCKTSSLGWLSPIWILSLFIILRIITISAMKHGSINFSYQKKYIAYELAIILLTLFIIQVSGIAYRYFTWDPTIHSMRRIGEGI